MPSSAILERYMGRKGGGRREGRGREGRGQEEGGEVGGKGREG